MYSVWRVNFLLPAFFPLPQAYILSMEGEFPPSAFFPLPHAYVLSMEGEFPPPAFFPLPQAYVLSMECGMLFYML